MKKKENTQGSLIPMPEDQNKDQSQAQAPPGMTVIVEFPHIDSQNLKTKLELDKKSGNIFVEIKFTAMIDNSVTLARIGNLISQKGASLFAMLGTKQAVMDFYYDMENKKVQIITNEPEPEETTQGQEPAPELEETTQGQNTGKDEKPPSQSKSKKKTKKENTQGQTPEPEGKDQGQNTGKDEKPPSQSKSKKKTKEEKPESKTKAKNKDKGEKENSQSQTPELEETTQGQEPAPGSEETTQGQEPAPEPGESFAEALQPNAGEPIGEPKGFLQIDKKIKSPFKGEEETCIEPGRYIPRVDEKGIVRVMAGDGKWLVVSAHDYTWVKEPDQEDISTNGLNDNDDLPWVSK